MSIRKRVPAVAGGLGAVVLLGGGRARFEQPHDAGGTTNVVDYAKAKRYQ
jgi:hypothetical protein